MRSFMRSVCRAGLVGGAALALSLVPANARAQRESGQRSVSDQASAVGQQNSNGDYDRMDQFLDDHKDIDKDLRANPSLVNSSKYLAHHKDLRTFLNDHPEMRQEFSEGAYFHHRLDRDEGRAGQNPSSSSATTANARNQDRDRDRDNAAGTSQNGYAPNGNQDRDQNRDQDRDRDAGVTNGQAANASPDQDQGRDQNYADRDRDQDRDRDANGQGSNPGLRTGEAAQLDRFLDDHQQIDKDLTANPSLANNNTYLDQHPDLRAFLNDHPDLREQFAKNPTLFMQRENRFDAREGRTTRDQDQDRDRNRDAMNRQNGYAADGSPDRDQDRDRTFTNRDQDRDQNPNPDLRNGELARMDQFLDDHQQINKELTAKPSLVNDQKYLAQHQDLRLFLNEHPQVREEFAENPTYFMNQEKRFDTQEDLRSRTGQNVGQPNRNTNPDRDQDRDRTFTSRDQDRDQNPNPDLRNWELARMDQFLDDHQQIDKSLTAKPSLINDQKYLSQHKDLQMFLNEHPQVREEFAENPTYFMHREDRFDSREFTGRTDADRDYSRSGSRAAANITDKQSADMDRFLDKHKDIDRDLAKNPSLCNDDKYLKHHKELRAFLDRNPEVRTQVASNARYFTQRRERMQEHAPVKTTKPPAKTPIEQHETTAPAAPH